MTRIFPFLVCVLFLVNISYAQGNLTGRVFENKTRIPLSGISIKNLKSGAVTVSDHNGMFAIRAHVGDLITFSGFSYQADTLYVKDLSSLEILLDLKQNMLNGITVTNSEIKLGNLTGTPTLAPFGGQTVVYQTDENGNYKGGLTAHIFDSNSAANKRKKDLQVGKDEELKQQIANVFSPENLKNYAPINGQEMDNFIILYTPSIETYASNNFNLTMYINSCYQEFIKMPIYKRQSKEISQLKTKPN